MVVTRYMNGKEITLTDLKNIKLTDNQDIAQLIDHAVARINRDAKDHSVSTANIPA
jgi:uncharacterized LabA/DUF88 family protein